MPNRILTMTILDNGTVQFIASDGSSHTFAAIDQTRNFGIIASELVRALLVGAKGRIYCTEHHNEGN